MLDLSEEDRLVRAAVRAFCDKRLAPVVTPLDRGEMLPYPIMSEFARAFGLADVLAATTGSDGDGGDRTGQRRPFGGRVARLFSIVMLELSRHSPGFALAFGASIGLYGGAVLARGTATQIATWATPVLSFASIGAWALTEPGAGSDAFGSMQTRARSDGDGYRLSGQKTFITNAPHADRFVVFAKTDDGRVSAFLVARDDRGVATGPAMRKMGMHASPTGELFLDDVPLPADRRLSGSGADEPDPSARAAAKASLTSERFAMVPMALGIVERCLEESIRYAKARVQWGRPIAELQLVQDKIARMYVAERTLGALFLRQIEAETLGTPLSPTEASAAKLYAARTATECAMEAVQIMGGAGYMSGSVVEMMARDAKLLQIGGGTDEVQIARIARDLLA
ncbi:MAG: acyl-CoA dehydrogenase family protein [Polyangiaceae bacterium]